jgi:hypothetical protein
MHRFVFGKSLRRKHQIRHRIFEMVTDTNTKQLENSMEAYEEMSAMCSISYSASVTATL